MKTGPVGRKTSFRVREWTKQSNSSLGAREPEPPEQPPAEQGKGGHLTSNELRPLPTLRIDSPLLTPDSNADGTARTGMGAEDRCQQDETGRVRPAGLLQGPLFQDRAREGRDEKSGGAGGSGIGGTNSLSKRAVRHTREERVWLHVNYRGEAPFLRAWGLDIATPTRPTPSRG
ncbi:hypothetical protein VTH06DRAFT_2805 [Thermothelomyces fergusii]